jgi:hypothetical protein
MCTVQQSVSGYLGVEPRTPAKEKFLCTFKVKMFLCLIKHHTRKRDEQEWSAPRPGRFASEKDPLAWTEKTVEWAIKPV